MKRSSIVVQLAFLAVIGCSAKTEPLSDAGSDAATTTQSDGGAASITFVSLKVPNMF
jgi:hypothetical protein